MVNRESSIDGRLGCSLFCLLRGRNGFSQRRRERGGMLDVLFHAKPQRARSREGRKWSGAQYSSTPRKDMLWHVPAGAF